MHEQILNMERNTLPNYVRHSLLYILSIKLAINSYKSDSHPCSSSNSNKVLNIIVNSSDQFNIAVPFTDIYFCLVWSHKSTVSLYIF